jgi:serine/threonine-protein kinase HipA
MPASESLTVWMNGMRVGVWTHARRGSHLFHYDPEWIVSPAGRVLSLSLPFTPGNVPHRGAVVANYFDNLLPDSAAIRARLRARFSTASTEAFDLLSAIGRDCVGAVQLLREDASPSGVHTVHADPLTEEEVEQTIDAAVSGTSLGAHESDDAFRISIAGAQEKTALLFHKGRWCRPRGATPTTHILKLPLGLIAGLQADMRDSVENEWLCSRLMQALGLPTARCEIREFGARKVLVVERFDRAWQGKAWIARLPQEDFCQALGLPGDRKYESDGGPGARDVFRILDASSQAVADKNAFLRALIVFWMLAAPDGHAKNFSLFHERGSTYRLTPFYDILSTWPIIGKGRGKIDHRKVRLAMAVRAGNPHWKVAEILPRHWNAMSVAAGLGDASTILTDLAATTPQAIPSVSRQLPSGFPARVSDSIFEGLQRSAQLILGGT